MKKIPLYALVMKVVGYARVSDGDFVRLNGYQWWPMYSGQSRYARRTNTGSKETIFMHQMVCPGDKKTSEVHHKDSDGWNNVRGNLRRLTRLEHSQLPRRKRRGKCSSKFVGVHWHAQHEKWCAEIKVGGKKNHLGLFTSELAARRVYLKAKRKLCLS